jgi:GntR family transcriptional repressor for pyruvate dehydrogenase complex
METTTRSRTTTEEIVDRLREMMHSGILKRGDRLPPERDLAKQLGVSRPTLRAGIRALTAVGVLHSIQGAGNFVIDSKEFPTLDTQPLRLLASLRGLTSGEMFETRLAIEMHIAGLAAERATHLHLAIMSEAVAEMFASIETPREYLKHDVRFHQIIAAASGNRILTALMNMVVKVLYETRSKSVHQAADLKESAESHRLIYRAIRDRDAQAAQRLMGKHLKETREAQEREQTGKETMAQKSPATKPKNLKARSKNIKISA